MKDLGGFDELVMCFDNMEKALSDKELSKVTRKGATQLLKSVRTRAPRDTGLLQEGIIIHKEKSRTRGKVGYDVMMDPQKNDFFQKPIKNRIRSKTKYGYYPASQEYGFFTRRPGGGMIYTRSDATKATMDKVPGKHYMLIGAEDISEAAKTTILEGVQEIIEKEFEG